MYEATRMRWQEKIEAMVMFNDRRKTIGWLGPSLTITINITLDIETISMVLQKTTIKTTNEYVKNNKHENNSETAITKAICHIYNSEENKSYFLMSKFYRIQVSVSRYSTTFTLTRTRNLL